MRVPVRSCLAALFAVASAAACSSAGTSNRYVGGGGGAGGSGGDLGIDPGGAGSGGGLGFDAGVSAGDGCSDAAKKIYLFTDSAQLYSFDPPSKTIKLVGQLQCPAGFLATPNSMAVDRSATAWVNYSDGSVFKVDTATAACTPTTYAPNPFGWSQMGMGFSSEAGNPTAERLFVASTSGGGLASITMPGLALQTIANFSGSLSGLSPELTGTGDGRLYGFFVSTGNQDAVVARIDKATAATSEEAPQSGINNVGAWAFSFWGGDFYLYTATTGSTSIVTRYHPADATSPASTSTYMSVAQLPNGIRIVGAGVSTCAPTKPPA